MKVLGIIAEYNPMHTGHIYHINKAKEITGCNNVVAIMSGSFTQQGNINILDKFTRANIAIRNGIDIVFELPCAFAISDAGNFANKNIQILDGLNVIDSICFGTENNNIYELKNIVNTLIEYDSSIWKEIKYELKKGDSFAKVRNKVLSKYLSYKEIETISYPNNILAIEYLKSLKLNNSNIIPFAIHRDNNFNKNDLNGSYTSSTSIRENLENNTNLNDIKNYLNEDIYNKLISTKLLFTKEIFELLRYKILSMKLDDIKNINLVTEGLENKIKKEIIKSTNYKEFIFKLKSKRYELSKIKRILINILLGITKQDFNDIKDNKANYAHILAFNHNKKDLLSYISKKSSIPLITSINKKTFSTLNTLQKKSLEIDIYSSNICSILNNTNMNKDYTNHI